ncbi:MAG: hypothetical protein ACHREM_10005 [Polyangiales bacterium]
MAGLAIAASGCLPADTRPVPGSVVVNVTGSVAVAGGIPREATTDGWSISFDRFLITIGNASLEGDACSPYNDAGYRRVFDGSALEPQRLSILYGLGTCGFSFRVRNPDFDSLLTAGVTADDLTMLRTPGTDTYATTDSAVSVYVRGHAQKGSANKTFTWSYRQPRLRFDGCAVDATSSYVLTTINANDALTFELALHAEALFQDALDPAVARLRFAPYADADDVTGNGDGDVSLDELGKVSLEAIGLSASQLATLDPTAASWTTFEDFVYLGLFPRIVRRADAEFCRSMAQNPN